MCYQIIISQLFTEFPLKQQELVAGDANFQLASNHRIPKVPSLQQTSNLGANGSTDKSRGTINQDLLQLGVLNVPTVVKLFPIAWQQAA